MTPVVAPVLARATALAALAIVWVAPAVGVTNSACEHYPRTSGGR